MVTARRVDISETREVFAQARAAAGMDEPTALGNVKNAVVQFTQVTEYTTFLAEYAFLDGNIIVHFFPPMEAYTGTGDSRRVVEEYLLYWQRRFPLVLSPVAEGYFKATLPVISATYTHEMQSWFFKAGGFANRLDPDGFVLGFFEQLDAALDRAAAALAPSSALVPA
jgi:hypothetical protein